MKNLTTLSVFHNDMRAVTSQGRVSKSRVVVLEALEAQGAEGATIDELAQLVGQDMPGENPKLSIGSVLSRMQTEEHLVCLRNRWYLAEHAPQSQVNGNGTGLPLVYSSNGQHSIAPMVQKRSGKTVSLYTTPEVYSDAIAIAMLSDQKWYKIPFFLSMRICIGHEAPNWSPEQEIYSNVEILRITHKNGKITEKRPAPTDLITVAAEET